jgi:cell division protein FtsB
MARKKLALFSKRRYHPVRRIGAPSKSKNLLPKILILGALILVVIFFFGDHGVYRLYSIKREKAYLMESIDSLRAEQEELISEKSKLENDLEYIERLARERHRMAKPGEKVFKVLEKEKR